jgi:hypothetical protein
VLAVLSAYAVLALLPLVRERARWAVVTAAVAAIAIERFVPPVSRLVVAEPFVPHAWQARPPDDDVRLVRATSGPILHVPFAHDGVKALAAADHLRLTSFAHRPTSACYNSLASPLTAQVAQLASALPAASAADALHALGFRTVLVHVKDMWPARAARFAKGVASRESGGRLRTLGRTPRLLALEIASPARTTSDEAALAAAPAPAAATKSQLLVAGTHAAVKVRVGNRARATFVRREPLQQVPVAARWRRSGGGDAARARSSVLLPAALGSGGSIEVAVPLDVPSQPGRYDVVLTGRSGRALASIPVEVAPPAQAVAVR